MNERQLAAEIVTLFSECRYEEKMKPLDWLTWKISDAISTRDDRIANLQRILFSAKEALLSYQHGNSSPELAKEVVAGIDNASLDERYRETIDKFGTKRTKL